MLVIHRAKKSLGAIHQLCGQEEGEGESAKSPRLECPRGPKFEKSPVFLESISNQCALEIKKNTYVCPYLYKNLNKYLKL